MIIINADIITWEENNRIVKNGAIVFQEDRIVEIGPLREMIEKYKQETIMDAHGAFIMPGSICAHTHFYGAFSRGMAIPGEAPKDLVEILEKLWWPLDKSLTEDAVKYSALVCQIDAIRHGTTTLIDHHASPFALENSLDIIADTVEQSGLRAVLCYEVTDRDGIAKAEAGIAENVRFIQALRKEPKPRIRATFGLHASLTLSDETLKKARKACPDEIGMHIHVAEGLADEDDSLRKSNMRVAERLSKHNILGSHAILAHAVHVNDHEMDIIARSKAWVTHQPRSNMNNAVGLPDVDKMLLKGIKVGMGNDGFSNTMWDEWKAAYLSHKLINSDPRRMQADTIAGMAAYTNADLVTQQYGQTVGKIVPGAQADLIIVEYQPFTKLTPENLPWHIIFGFNESMIRSTIVAGKVLMEDRKLVSMNEKSITEEAKVLSEEIWNHYKSRFM
ncbi:MAG: putative aminohydrolase SsnA [Anaerolineaceae bacterium]|nr:putative aminohydrolase SsnA [Anaerolineaceae bacterium]